MEPTQDSAKQNDAPANYENAFMYWHERAMAADQTVERLERENKRLFDDWKACRDALKGNINDPDPLPCTDERSLTLYGMVAGVLRSRDDLKQQVAQLREDVSKIECELSEWKLASAANETGHLFRCARVNGKWSCAKGCHAAAHTTLQGLVETACQRWRAQTNAQEGISFRMAMKDLEAALPREGGAQDTISTKTLPSQYLGNGAEVKGDIS